MRPASRVLVIGAEGAVGGAICDELSGRHEIIRAGRNSGNIQVDIEDQQSIEAMYQTVGCVDAVVCAAGAVHYSRIDEISEDQFWIGLQSKLMGQVNTVRVGIAHLTNGGSFTLTSGVTNRDPIREGSASAAVNGAIDGFVVSAAIEMPRGIRINSVSPDVLEVSAEIYEGVFPGHVPVPSELVGLAYVKSVEGAITGQVIVP